MPVPVFSVGEVLTSSAMNQVGMWKISSGTFSAATSVDVTGFSSNYTSYHLVYSARRTDAVGTISSIAQFRSSTTAQASGYYYGAGYANYVSASGSLVAGNNTSSMWWNGGDSFPSFSYHSFDIYLAQNVGVTWHGTGYYTGNAYGWFYGGSVATSLTIDRLRVSYTSAGSASGEWALYGYRK